MVCCDFVSVVGFFLSLLVLYKILDRLVRIPRIGPYGDHYVLITGCGHGMGLEAVRRLESLGCHVFAGCRKQESVDELKKTVSDLVQPILMDVSNPESVRSAFEYVSSKLPKNTGLWGLVNNAAIVDILPIELCDSTSYRRMVDTNLLGTVDATMTFLPLVKKARGRIVNVSSYGGRITLPINVSYSVSKYGLEAFTDGLRRSIRMYGCKVLLIEPGGVKTNIATPERILEGFNEAFRKMNPDDHATEEGQKLLKQQREKLLKMMSASAYEHVMTPIEKAVESYEHALFGVYPRARYVVGKDAKFMIFIQMLPECLSDWLIGSKMPAFQCRVKSGV